MKITEVDNQDSNLALKYVTTALNILNQPSTAAERITDTANLLGDVEAELGDIEKVFWERLDDAVEAGDPKELELTIMELREKATKAIIKTGKIKSDYKLDQYFRRMIGYYLTTKYWPKNERNAGMYHAKRNMKKFSKETIRFFNATQKTGVSFSDIEPTYVTKAAAQTQRNERIEGLSKKIVDALFNTKFGMTEDEAAVIEAIKDIQSSLEYSLVSNQYSKDTKDEDSSSKDLVKDIYKYLSKDDINEISKHLQSLGMRFPSEPEDTE